MTKAKIKDKKPCQMINYESRLAESQVIRLWETLLESGYELATDAGEPIDVIYPGRLNDNFGADRRDTVIVSSQGENRGDIEFHVCSSDWRAHGHAKNPAYKNVVLHVVMWDNDNPIYNSSGVIPTLSLSRYLNTGVMHLPPANGHVRAYRIPCEDIYYNCPERVISFLETAGEARFQEKAACFRQELSAGNTAQILYRNIFGALGYAKNKIPCLELANKMPLSNLAHGTDVLETQALLMGTAGLLPSQSYKPASSGPGGSVFQIGPTLTLINQDDFVRCLETIWRRHTGNGEVMPSGSWNSYKIRPQNTPVRRVAAMAYLLRDYHRQGLFEFVRSVVIEITKEEVFRLKDRMVVAGDGYWLDHFNFGRLSRHKIPNLIGKNRAAEIVVNILLPLIYAWAALNSDSGLMVKASGLYHAFPGLATNSIEKHLVCQLGLNAGILNLAIRQQGLLHLYKSYCVKGRCEGCLLSY